MTKHILMAFMLAMSTSAFSAGEYCLSDVCLFDKIDKFKFDGVKWQKVEWVTYPICDLSRARQTFQHDTPDGLRANVSFEYVPGAPKGAHFQVISIIISLPSDITQEQGQDIQKTLVQRMGLQRYQPQHGRKMRISGTPYYRKSIQDGTIELDVSFPGQQSRTFSMGGHYTELKFVPDEA